MLCYVDVVMPTVAQFLTDPIGTVACFGALYIALQCGSTVPGFPVNVKVTSRRVVNQNTTAPIMLLLLVVVVLLSVLLHLWKRNESEKNNW